MGYILGDVEILENQPTQAMVTCETGVDAIVLERHQLEGLMVKYPELKERLWKTRGVSVAAALLGNVEEYKVKGGTSGWRVGRSDRLVFLVQLLLLLCNVNYNDNILINCNNFAD